MNQRTPHRPSRLIVGSIAVAFIWFQSRAHAADYTVHVVEPPVTDHMILPNGPLPEVCKVTTSIDLTACRGQYVPASFVVTTDRPLEAVRVQARRFRGVAGGLRWPADVLDVRVVKAYYRRAPGGGVKAIPTLLVHDESFLRIEAASTEDNPDASRNVLFEPARDADELAPVDIAGRKQFWLTVHVPDNAPAGDYMAKIRIVPANSDPTTLTLKVRVYAFELLDPMIEYSIYYPAYLQVNQTDDSSYKFGRLSKQQMLAEFRNMVAHGLANPNIYGALRRREDGSLDFTKLDDILDLREQAGMRSKSLYLVGHPIPFSDRPPTDENKERINMYVPQVNAWAEARGYDHVFFMAHDEWWGEQLERERDSMVAVRDAGGKFFTAVMQTPFYTRVGDVLTRPVLQSSVNYHIEQAVLTFEGEYPLHHVPEFARAGLFTHMVNHDGFRRAIDGIHRQGRKIYTYMNPMAGTAMPDLQRRNEGLGLWRVGFDGTMNWAYTHITGESDNQDMIYAKVFRTKGGVLDTLHYEGFRAGVDDVRYLTTLLHVLGATMGRFPAEALVSETHTWLRDINVAHGDLDAIRREMAQRIGALMDLGYRELSPEELLADVDISEVRVTQLSGTWRFRPDPADLGEKDSWFVVNTDMTPWGRVRTDIDKGWEKQGYAEQAVGYGWYRTPLVLAPQDTAKSHRYLYFGAVDEDAWVYLNDKKIFEHTTKTTGILPSEIWLTPFTVPLAKVRLGENVLVVRAYNRGGMGGIWKPVHMICTDQPLSHKQIQAVVQMREGERSSRR